MGIYIKHITVVGRQPTTIFRARTRAHARVVVKSPDFATPYIDIGLNKKNYDPVA
jgi:hypothetical protein